MAKKRSAVHQVLKEVPHCASNSEGPQFIESELLASGELILRYGIALPRPSARGGRRNVRTGPQPKPMRLKRGAGEENRSAPTPADAAIPPAAP